MQAAGETIIRPTMFLGGMTSKEWADGVFSKDAYTQLIKVHTLLDDIDKTQGRFTKTTSPLYAQTWIGRAMLQMNRWVITDLMLVNRIATGAYNEWKSGKKTGPNTTRLFKMIALWGIASYLTYQLAKRGHKTAAKLLQTIGQLGAITWQIVGGKPIDDMITNNPTVSGLEKLWFSWQILLSYVNSIDIPAPSKIVMQGGVESTFLSPVRTVKNIFGIRTYDDIKKKNTTDYKNLMQGITRPTKEEGKKIIIRHKLINTIDSLEKKLKQVGDLNKTNPKSGVTNSLVNLNNAIIKAKKDLSNL